LALRGDDSVAAGEVACQRAGVQRKFGDDETLLGDLVCKGAVAGGIDAVDACAPNGDGASFAFERALVGGGVDALAEALAALEGVWLPAGLWESVVLPARVVDYRPAMLDELIASGEVVWQARPVGDATSRSGSARVRTGANMRAIGIQSGPTQKVS